MNQIQVRQVDYKENAEAIHQIRAQVFHQEQKVPKEIDLDGMDEQAIQFLAYVDDKPAGTCRVTRLDENSSKIQRLAVLKECRGKGLARLLMNEGFKYIEENHKVKKVVLTAQLYLRKFYGDLGYQEEGEEFEEAGIPHIKMIKYLRH